MRAGQIVGMELDVKMSMIESSIVCRASVICLSRKTDLTSVCGAKGRGRGVGESVNNVP